MSIKVDSDMIFSILKVYNSIGMLVLEQRLDDYLVVINTELWSSGSYSFVVSSNEKIMSKVIIKQ